MFLWDFTRLDLKRGDNNDTLIGCCPSDRQLRRTQRLCYWFSR
jgi:hypothetical protein